MRIKIQAMITIDKLDKIGLGEGGSGNCLESWGEEAAAKGVSSWLSS